jgi:hypothetical protein
MDSQATQNAFPADLVPLVIANTFTTVNNRVVPSLEKLLEECQQTIDELQPLDNAARHDEMVDDATYQRIARKRYDFDIARRVSTSLDWLRGAQQDALGRFYGETKGKTEGRLERGVRQLEELLQLFQQLESEMTPREVYLIRQDALTRILWPMGELLAHLRYRRGVLKKTGVMPEVYSTLTGIEAPLYRIRSTWTKMRDNPSQKMTSKLQESHQQLASVLTAYTALKQQLWEKCEAIPIKWNVRCGPTNLWVGTIKGEPYTLELEARLKAFLKE